MRINNPKYKSWKKSHDQKLLIKRTKRQKGEKKKKKSKIHHIKFKKLTAPEKLSLIDYSEESIEYFSEAINILQSKLNKNKYDILLFDVSKVKYLTIDALMYLLAIIQNIKFVSSGIKKVSGNLPIDDNAKEKFVQSGFLSHVKSNLQGIEYQKDLKLKISTGNDVNVSDAAKLIDFVNNYFGTTKVKTKFLYKMIIELMTNTNNHAYNNNAFIKKWFLFSSVNEEKKCVEISFLDTGEGIPRTVAKKVMEKVLTKKDNEYIISALNGEFRTQTKEVNRGKGLPDIYGHYNAKEIHNLKIISCKGKINLSEHNMKVENAGIELNNYLQGTVYYWELYLNGVEEI